VAAPGGRPYRRPTVRKVLVDMHVPPAWRRWLTRVSLALAVAVVIAYVPYRLTGGGDDRVLRLRTQLDENRGELRRLEAVNARLLREIDGLRSDVGAIEDRARDELGMVYPGELVLRVAPAAPEATP
jgi:cell division protein FtsB